jgi:Protein of unknown function (DUF2637)
MTIKINEDYMTASAGGVSSPPPPAPMAAIISYRHAYELVRAHGESGATARLVPLTVDGLIWAASMVILEPIGVPNRYHLWPGGASVSASSPPSGPTWRTV